MNEKLPRNTRDLCEMWVDFANITNGLREQTTHRHERKTALNFFRQIIHYIVYPSLIRRCKFHKKILFTCKTDCQLLIEICQYQVIRMILFPQTESHNLTVIVD